MKKAVLLFFCWLAATVAIAQNFVTKWTYPAADTKIQFTASTDGAVNYTWTSTSNPTGGSGSFTGGSGATLALVTLNIPVAAGDVVTLNIEPTNFRRFGFGTGDGATNPIYTIYAEKLTAVESWGAVPWNSMGHAFMGCSNLNVTATDIPILSNVTNMIAMFSACSALTGPANINGWDVSNVTNMAAMFQLTAFNQNISSWDVGNVTDMTSMFQQANAFNQDISGWDVSNVVNMAAMFILASSFNQDISGWDVSNVVDMQAVFANATSFNQNLGAWNLESLTGNGAPYMFYNSGLTCENYSRTIKGWAENPNTANNVKFENQNGMVYANTAATYHSTLESKGWNITNDAEAAPGSPCYNMVLPVTFGNISAVLKNGQLLLNWQSLTEKNNSYFEIEASADGENFHKIGEVKTLAENGNSEVVLSYNFTTGTAGLALGLVPLLALGIGLFTTKGRSKILMATALAVILAIGYGCNKNNDIAVDKGGNTMYVRIAQVDKDHTKSYSKVVKVVAE